MKKINDLLLVVIILFSMILSLIGILDSTLYNQRVNTITRYELYGQDSITFLISLITLVLFILLKESIWKQIIVCGVLLYLVYVYGYYIFSLVQTKYYIFYMLVFSLSIFKLMHNTIGLYKKEIDINEKYPRKAISVFFFIIIFIMYIIEIPYLIKITFINNKPIRMYEMFYLFDTTLIFPLIVITGIKNLQKKKGNEYLVGILLLKILTIMPAIIMNDLFHYFATKRFIDFNFDIIAFVICAISLVFILLYKRGINITTAST